MKREYLLVDGYNIIHAWPELMELSEVSLESARYRLMDIMSNYQGLNNGLTVIVVFDGYLVKGSLGAILEYNNIFMVFTKEAETADHYIEKTVNKMPRECKIRVATSDGLEQLIILGNGAIRMSARELKLEVEDAQNTMREEFINNKPPKNNLLMDNLDEHTRSILEAMRRQKK
ncbi:NYN domain-containing protein [Lachnospiraceae bacterium NSJ-143]|nr:NYN domain-containing protein [Lachnospiraceae bacterium NSJ-143]